MLKTCLGSETSQVTALFVHGWSLYRQSIWQACIGWSLKDGRQPRCWRHFGHMLKVFWWPWMGQSIFHRRKSIAQIAIIVHYPTGRSKSNGTKIWERVVQVDRAEYILLANDNITQIAGLLWWFNNPSAQVKVN